MYFIKIIYLSLAVVDLLCCTGFSLILASEGFSLVVVHGLLVVAASLVLEHGPLSFWSTGLSHFGARASLVLEHGPLSFWSTGFSRFGARALGLTGCSGCDSRPLEHRLDSSGAWA